MWSMTFDLPLPLTSCGSWPGSARRGLEREYRVSTTTRGTGRLVEGRNWHSRQATWKNQDVWQFFWHLYPKFKF